MSGAELHVISTGKQSIAALASIAAGIHPYVDAFHLRERSKTARELIEGIEQLLAAGVPAGRIVINDRADVAAAARVGGVQLAYHSLNIRAVKRLFPPLRVGKSVHDLEEAQAAEAEGADYVIYGHIYATASKPELPARGIESLRRLADCVNIPVIAIGGIKPGNVKEVISAGAAGVAVMSGILEAEDPVAQAHAIYHHIHMKEQGHEQSS